MTIGVNKGHSGMQRHMPKNAIEAKVAVNLIACQNMQKMVSDW